MPKAIKANCWLLMLLEMSADCTLFTLFTLVAAVVIGDSDLGQRAVVLERFWSGQTKRPQLIICSD